MSKLSLYQGTTSKNLSVYIANSTTGAGLTGLTYSTSGLTAYYFAEGASASTSLPLVAGALGAWLAGGFFEIDATHMPGLYQLGAPNTAFSTGKSVTIVLKGAASMTETVLEIECTATNNQDSERGGILALPNGNMMVKKNQLLNGFTFLMVSSADHVTPVAGLTITSLVSLDGGALVATVNSATPISNGLYTINLGTADMNGTNVTLMFAAAGADTRFCQFITQP